MAMAEIEHTGYRGPLTNNLFLPAGKYTVGNELNIPLRIVPDELARYLVDTGQATMTLEKADGLPISEAVEVESDQALSEEDLAMSHWSDEERLEISLEYLNGLTVEELREFADRHSISIPASYMKKADLIELIAHAAVQPDPDDGESALIDSE